MLDGRGNTALQIVCGIHQHENTYLIAKILLDKGVSYKRLCFVFIYDT